MNVKLWPDLLHSNPGMSLIHPHCKLISDSLDLSTKERSFLYLLQFYQHNKYFLTKFVRLLYIIFTWKKMTQYKLPITVAFSPSRWTQQVRTSYTKNAENKTCNWPQCKCITLISIYLHVCDNTTNQNCNI